MRKFLLVCVMFVGGLAARAQQVLRVGDRVSDRLISGVINYPKNSIQIKDFKDQLLILDFGFTGCGGCIEMLPTIDRLARDSGGTMQYFWVTYEPASMVKKFFENNRQLRGISVPTITGAKALYVQYGVTVAPQEVWIRNNQVIAITGSDYLSRKNIGIAAAAKGPLGWAERANISADFAKEPLLDFRNTEIPKSVIKFYSTVAGPLPVAPYISQLKTFQTDSAKGFTRLSVYYKSILALYRFAIEIPEQGELPLSKIFLLEVRDKSIYDFRYHSAADPVMSYSSAWHARYGHSYDSTAPLGLSEAQMKAKMIQDLNFYFQVNGRRETRQAMAAVVRLKAGSPSQQADRTGQQDFFLSGGKGMITPIALVSYLNSESGPQSPVYVDETGYEDKMLIDLKGTDINDPAKVKERLERCGLELVSEQRPFSFIVITELH